MLTKWESSSHESVLLFKSLVDLTLLLVLAAFLCFLHAVGAI